MTSNVAIIIINWNNSADTIQCLESLTENLTMRPDIYVLDNDSNSDDFEYLSSHSGAFPNTTVLRSHTNLGFAGGCNWLLQHIRTQSVHYEYFWFLNNDTTIDSHALDSLMAAMEEDASIGIAGSLIFFYDDPSSIWFAGGKITRWLGSTQHIHFGKNVNQIPPLPFIFEVDYASGCSMLIRTKALDKVGDFDESYFLYFEETDLNLRMQRDGWKNVVVSTSHVFHKVSRSLKDEPSLKKYYFYRAQSMFFKKHFRPWIPLVVLRSLFAIPYHIIKGRWSLARALFKGNLDGLLWREERRVSAER